MHPNNADEMANRVDQDQTAPIEQSDLGLHCLLRLVYSNYLGSLRYNGTYQLTK